MQTEAVRQARAIVAFIVEFIQSVSRGLVERDLPTQYYAFEDVENAGNVVPEEDAM